MEAAPSRQARALEKQDEEQKSLGPVLQNNSVRVPSGGLAVDYGYLGVILG